tara:strand:+ start:1239 stop:1820 length:582 start_codon:yes stop_codon:yes gene_type:complete
VIWPGRNAIEAVRQYRTACQDRTSHEVGIHGNDDETQASDRFCEDSRLAGYQGDTLFRVNWIWVLRPWLTAPDMVFTADPDLDDLPRQPVIAFPTRATGEPIPISGALMGALAAALRPARLVISGIDLYLHPQGKYPGGADNPEGYTDQHSAQTDLDLIGRAIAGYNGRLIILSDNLLNAHAALNSLQVLRHG